MDEGYPGEFYGFAKWTKCVERSRDLSKSEDRANTGPDGSSEAHPPVPPVAAVAVAHPGISRYILLAMLPLQHSGSTKRKIPTIFLVQQLTTWMSDRRDLRDPLAVQPGI